LYILINLLNIVNNKGRFYYDAKFLNTQTSLHQLTIINNNLKKISLINKTYLFYIMLKKNNKRLFTLLQPFNQLISQSSCSVGVDVKKAPSDFLLAITYHLAI